MDATGGSDDGSTSKAVLSARGGASSGLTGVSGQTSQGNWSGIPVEHAGASIAVGKDGTAGACRRAISSQKSCGSPSSTC